VFTGPRGQPSLGRLRVEMVARSSSGRPRLPGPQSWPRSKGQPPGRLSQGGDSAWHRSGTLVRSARGNAAHEPRSGERSSLRVGEAAAGRCAPGAGRQHRGSDQELADSPRLAPGTDAFSRASLWRSHRRNSCIWWMATLRGRESQRQAFSAGWALISQIPIYFRNAVSRGSAS
jgi:hypothetical protein